MAKGLFIAVIALLAVSAFIFVSFSSPGGAPSGQLIGPDCDALCDDNDPCTLQVCLADGGCDYVDTCGSSVLGPESTGTATEEEFLYIEAQPVAGIGVIDARVEGDELMIIFGLKDADGKETVDDGEVTFRLIENGDTILCEDEVELEADDFYQIHYSFTGQKFIAYSWKLPLSECADADEGNDVVGELTFATGGDEFSAQTAVVGL